MVMECFRWISPLQGQIVMGLDREARWAGRPCEWAGYSRTRPESQSGPAADMVRNRVITAKTIRTINTVGTSFIIPVGAPAADVPTFAAKSLRLAESQPVVKPAHQPRRIPALTQDHGADQSTTPGVETSASPKTQAAKPSPGS